MGEAGGLNLYGFCHNDGVNLSDPTGMCYVVDDILQDNLPSASEQAPTPLLSVADQVRDEEALIEQGYWEDADGTVLNNNTVDNQSPSPSTPLPPLMVFVEYAGGGGGGSGISLMPAPVGFNNMPSGWVGNQMSITGSTTNVGGIEMIPGALPTGGSSYDVPQAVKNLVHDVGEVMNMAGTVVAVGASVIEVADGILTENPDVIEEGGQNLDIALQDATQETPQILQNAANGRAFEQQGLNYLQTINSDVAEQVSVRPFTESGELADFRVRLDALGTDNSGNVNWYDFKSSATAGFTPNQEEGYPLLQKFGGQVVGGNGGLAYPAGTLIPPTSVTILRPGSF